MSVGGVDSVPTISNVNTEENGYDDNTKSWDDLHKDWKADNQGHEDFDDYVQAHLNEGGTIVFSVDPPHGDDSYEVTVSKDEHTDKYVATTDDGQEVDSNVQINSDYTIDGFVEITGLPGSGGEALYIGMDASDPHADVTATFGSHEWDNKNQNDPGYGELMIHMTNAGNQQTVSSASGEATDGWQTPATSQTYQDSTTGAEWQLTGISEDGESFRWELVDDKGGRANYDEGTVIESGNATSPFLGGHEVVHRPDASDVDGTYTDPSGIEWTRDQEEDGVYEWTGPEGSGLTATGDADQPDTVIFTNSAGDWERSADPVEGSEPPMYTWTLLNEEGEETDTVQYGDGTRPTHGANVDGSDDDVRYTDSSGIEWTRGKVEDGVYEWSGPEGSGLTATGNAAQPDIVTFTNDAGDWERSAEPVEGYDNPPLWEWTTTDDEGETTVQYGGPTRPVHGGTDKDEAHTELQGSD